MSEGITNEAGQVAIRYYQPAPVLVQKTPSGTDYYFDVRAAISLAWVKPEDVDNIIQRKRMKECCGGPRSPFDYANEAAVRIWTNRGGR